MESSVTFKTPNCTQRQSLSLPQLVLSRRLPALGEEGLWMSCFPHHPISKVSEPSRVGASSGGKGSKDLTSQEQH